MQSIVEPDPLAVLAEMTHAMENTVCWSECGIVYNNLR